jgi:membrane-associated phospholipid phosphatase
LFLDFVHNKRSHLSLIWYILGIFGTLLGIVGVMCSRVYLAAHSIN